MRFASLLLLTMSVLAATTAMAIAFGAQGTLSVFDNFNDNVRNARLWQQDAFGTGTSIAEANGRVEIAYAANAAEAASGNSFGVSYDDRCALSGNFDIQVDFNLLDWPSGNGVRMVFYLGPADGGNGKYYSLERTSFGNSTTDFPGSPREVYTGSGPTGMYAITGTSDLTGKLRIARVGDTVTSYRANGDTWMAIGSSSGDDSADIRFHLDSHSHNIVFTDRAVRSAWDNVVVSADEISCPLPVNGDLDCDGAVLARDALVAAVHQAGAAQISREIACPDLGTTIAVISVADATAPTIFGDVNCDGVADIRDALPVLAYVIGIPPRPALPAGCAAVGAPLPVPVP